MVLDPSPPPLVICGRDRDTQIHGSDRATHNTHNSIRVRDRDRDRDRDTLIRLYRSLCKKIITVQKNHQCLQKIRRSARKDSWNNMGVEPSNQEGPVC